MNHSVCADIINAEVNLFENPERKTIGNMFNAYFLLVSIVHWENYKWNNFLVKKSSDLLGYVLLCSVMCALIILLEISDFVSFCTNFKSKRKGVDNFRMNKVVEIREIVAP